MPIGRTRVKICGITRVEDALAAAQAGADAIGLVFYEGSPRQVTVDQAAQIVAALPPCVTVVGLFVNAPRAEVEAVLSAVPIDLLQFHGEETPAACRGYGRRYMKAVRMREGVDLAVEAGRYADAAALLLDAYVPDRHGGTGTRFDWTRVPTALDKPVILAGGLTPDNVAQAIRQTRPYAVDVSGGVEAAKGIKDAIKMRAFVRNVNSVET
jgi:phosphoribosylanthranilate isomerase